MFRVSGVRVFKIDENYFFEAKCCAFWNSVESFNTCTVLKRSLSRNFEKLPFNLISRLTQSTVCNATKNKLQIKFLKEALEPTDNLHGKLQAFKLQPSALRDFQTLKILLLWRSFLQK